MNRICALGITVILAFSCMLMVESANAQTTSKLLVPEFTVSYVDNSYDVPTTYEIDQFTGEKIVAKQGYHVDDKLFEFKIKNQHFTPYIDSYGNNNSVLYNLRFKGPYGNEWLYFPFSANGEGVRKCSAGIFTIYDPKLLASSSEYTIIRVNFPNLFHDVTYPSIGNQVEFQAQALMGYVSFPGEGDYRFVGQSSDWSSTQTITIGESSSSSPATTPSVPEFPTIASLIAVLAAVSLLLLVCERRQPIIKN